MSDSQKAAAAALLEWYVAMGVDCALSDDPIDWRNKLATVSPSPATPQQTTTGHNPTNPKDAPKTAVTPPQAPASGRFAVAQSPVEAASQAREQAKSAKSLEDLEAILKGFEGCALKATAKNLCFYRGSPSAPIAIIGEAPGRDEDIQGKPFVGRAGQLLDKMLASIGLSESDVHITNVV